MTKQIQILSGSGYVFGKWRKVNVIDTIGFCDTTLAPTEVLALIKQKIRTNILHVDRVLIVCSGRIERDHVAAIKQIMEWLKYDDGYYNWNFTFLYNKADQMLPAQRERNLITMCSLLGVGNHAFRDQWHKKNMPSVNLRGEDPGDERIGLVFNMKIACGFPPQATYAEIESDLHILLDNMFIPGAQNRRIPVEDTWCSIL